MSEEHLAFEAVQVMRAKAQEAQESGHYTKEELIEELENCLED